ncbi:DUF6207 family protein [Streptomyces sp. NPDC005408]|uniref:DUF6207 family protein n=1 Tax=Streptomyces sp. NPDC005408 TaxID=3155341 RepID=UPI0033B14BA2
MAGPRRQCPGPNALGGESPQRDRRCREPIRHRRHGKQCHTWHHRQLASVEYASPSVTTPHSASRIARSGDVRAGQNHRRRAVVSSPMTQDMGTSPALVRIEITAADLATAAEAAEKIAGLWLSTPSPPRGVPGEDGVHVQVHADTSRGPSEGGQ